MTDKESKPLRIAIAAGGTGGHIMPALALAQALNNIGRPVKVDFVCGNRPVELDIYAKAGIKPMVLSVGATSGTPLQKLWQRVALGFSFLKFLLLARRYDVMVGMGGYITAPVLTAACFARVPYILHDSNTVLGRVNRILAPKAPTTALERVIRIFGSEATALALGLPLAQIPEKVFANRLHVIGTPVRLFIAKGDRKEAAKEMYLNPDAFTLFINGGSLGARGLNQLMAQTLGVLSASWPNDVPMQVIWSTGQANFEETREALAAQPVKGQVFLAPSIERMDLAYSLTNLVICRAGGSTLAEMLLCGLPSILFPLPIAAEDHQRHNALALVKEGAAILLDEREVDAKRVASEIVKLVKDAKRLRKMANAARKMASPDAARDLASIVVRATEKR
jgi:UDP-N-acetylglucosamine--N-acetylmuramyl-(pentapeptide) pyrophosphoryl-undecaprenol N-acetylglucosamine transferase